MIDEAPLPDPPQSPPAASDVAKRVLVLDDEPAMLRLLSDYLRAPHLELVTCAEIEAAECLLEHVHFDVLITDLEVSDLGGLEGMRLIRYVTCNFPEVEVIVFSGKLDDEVRKLARALGAADVMLKPGDLPRIRKRLASSAADLGANPSRDGRPGRASRVETLDEVLESRGISSVLQPIFGIVGPAERQRPFGVEGLARGPVDSLLRNPEILLGYASRKEMLFQTELQCIEAVLREAQTLPADSRLFINVRPRSLTAPGAAAALSSVVRRAGRQQDRVVFELTEQQTILNPQAFKTTLHDLKRCGFQIALDDYGQGFANLHLVHELRPDYLKIDGLFCHEIQLDDRKQALVRSTVEMARELGISTIMEHVESASELEVIRELGVTHAQGYYFSRPLPGKELVRWFESPAALLATVRGARAADASPQPAAARPGAAPEDPAGGRSPQVSRLSAYLHEISNLLAGVSLCAQHRSQTLPPADPVRLDFERIGRAAELAIEQSRKLRREESAAPSPS